MAGSIVLSERETSTLIRESGGAILAIEFGTGGVRLKRDAGGQIMSAWALPILERMRGQAHEQGSGI